MADNTDKMAIRLGLRGKKLDRLVDYLDYRAGLLDEVNNSGWWLVENIENDTLYLVPKEEFSEMFKPISATFPNGMQYAVNMIDMAPALKVLFHIFAPFAIAYTWIATLFPRIRQAINK